MWTKKPTHVRIRLALPVHLIKKIDRMVKERKLDDRSHVVEIIVYDKFLEDEIRDSFATGQEHKEWDVCAETN